MSSPGKQGEYYYPYATQGVPARNSAQVIAEGSHSTGHTSPGLHGSALPGSVPYYTSSQAVSSPPHYIQYVYPRGMTSGAYASTQSSSVQNGVSSSTPAYVHASHSPQNHALAQHRQGQIVTPLTSPNGTKLAQLNAANYAGSQVFSGLQGHHQQLGSTSTNQPSRHVSVISHPVSSTQQSHSNLHQSSIGHIPRQRRRTNSKPVVEVNYAVNYPAHMVPLDMYIPTGPPNGTWRVLPPQPDDIKSRRYATGVDERNYFTVLEYEINDQPIIWDYYTGYVHLTGIWKAVGNSKADIVKLLDGAPELEPVIKRVRGGFLKIQGTWVPYKVARLLAVHVCYYIRFALVPLFGADFPSQCLKPNDPGFGVLQLNIPLSLEHQRTHDSSSNSSTQSSPVHAAPEASHDVSVPMPVAAPQPIQIPSTMGATSPRFLSRKLPHLAPTMSAPAAGAADRGVIRHNRNMSDGGSGFKQRRSSSKSVGRPRTNSAPQRRDSFAANLYRGLPLMSSEAYDENVFDDDEAEPSGGLSPPPMPRKVSFTDEEKVSESPTEFIEMLKATRLLQQMSSGRRTEQSGGGFECAGRMFIWDGVDKLDVVSNVPSGNQVSTSVPSVDVATGNRASVISIPGTTTPPSLSQGSTPLAGSTPQTVGGAAGTHGAFQSPVVHQQAQVTTASLESGARSGEHIGHVGQQEQPEFYSATYESHPPQLAPLKIPSQRWQLAKASSVSLTVKPEPTPPAADSPEYGSPSSTVVHHPPQGQSVSSSVVETSNRSKDTSSDSDHPNAELRNDRAYEEDRRRRVPSLATILNI